VKKLLASIHACTICKDHLPFDPRPVVQAGADAKIIIIGQAPGLKVQQSGVPWDDASGKKLREWLGVDETVFYDRKKIALVPMGFCYPGKGSSGDKPPRPECAPQWHSQLLQAMKKIELTILIGQYAQGYYLGENVKRNLTETVKQFSVSIKNNNTNTPVENYFIPLPHPSPRNRFWHTKNKWFERETVPFLQQQVKTVLSDKK
jgi:uracil-DNA glycosylase